MRMNSLEPRFRPTELRKHLNKHRNLSWSSKLKKGLDDFTPQSQCNTHRIGIFVSVERYFQV